MERSNFEKELNMNKKFFAGTVVGLTAGGAAYAFYRTRSSCKPEHADIHGFVAPGFETVRDTFVENFALRDELGGACCAYRNGENIVDLWGGVGNKTTGEAWDEDTMVVV